MFGDGFGEAYSSYSQHNVAVLSVKLYEVDDSEAILSAATEEGLAAAELEDEVDDGEKEVRAPSTSTLHFSTLSPSLVSLGLQSFKL